MPSSTASSSCIHLFHQPFRRSQFPSVLIIYRCFLIYLIFSKSSLPRRPLSPPVFIIYSFFYPLLSNVSQHLVLTSYHVLYFCLYFFLKAVPFHVTLPSPPPHFLRDDERETRQEVAVASVGEVDAARRRRGDEEGRGSRLR